MSINEDVSTFSEDLSRAFASKSSILSSRVSKLVREKISGHKNSDRELKEEYLRRNPKQINPYAFAWSYKTKKDVNFDGIDLNRHTAISGMTGAGKDMVHDCLKEEALKRGNAIVDFDPKMDLASLKRFLALNKKYDRKCYVFSDVLPNSDKCNPILEGPNNVVVDRTFSIFDWGEPYYSDANYVGLIDGVAALRAQGKKTSLMNIHKYMENNLKTKETLNIINKLRMINDSSFGKILSGGDDAVTFSKISEEGASIYIGLSTLGYPQIASFIAKLFIYELMYHSYETYADFTKTEKEKLKNPFMVHVNEMESVVDENFMHAYNKVRGAGIGFKCSFQTVHDLDTISPVFKKRFIANTNSFIIGHSHEPEEKDYLSKVIGTHNSQKQTEQLQDGIESGMASVRTTREFNCHPDLLGELGVGDFVVVNNLPRKHIDLIHTWLPLDSTDPDNSLLDKYLGGKSLDEVKLKIDENIGNVKLSKINYLENLKKDLDMIDGKLVAPRLNAKITRLEWCERAFDYLVETIFKDSDNQLKNVKVVIGECKGEKTYAHTVKTGEDEYKIVINKALDSTSEIFENLAHECVHCCVGLDYDHGKVFKELALEVGLRPPLSKATGSKSFLRNIKAFINEFGEFPDEWENYE